MVHVFAQAVCISGKEEELRTVLRDLRRRSEAETGVLRYEVFEAEGGRFFFHEQYHDETAFETHKSSRHVRSAFARARPLMQGDLAWWVASPLSDAGV